MNLHMTNGRRPSRAQSITALHIAVSSAALAALLRPAAAPAVTASWIAGNGAFSTSANWSTGAAPNSADTAVFARGTGLAYSVTFVGPLLGSPFPLPDYFSDRAVVGNNAVSFVNSGRDREPGTYTLSNPTTTESGRALMVGDAAADTAASLTVNISRLSAPAATIGNAAGSNGTLNFSGGARLFITASHSLDTELIVGNSGTGALNVTANADATLAQTNSGAVLANRANSTGTLTVSGAGSTFSIPNGGFGLTVGNAGNGTLNVTAGGAVNSSVVRLGGAQLGRGTVTVADPGSTLTSSSIIVGDHAPGTLNVQNAAGVTTNQLNLGTSNTDGTGHGTVKVDGAGALLQVNSIATIGVAGTGILNVTSGGQASNPTGAILGYNAGASGNATVAGAGSAWTTTNTLVVGRGGSGSLTVNTGGQISAGSLQLAELAGGSASLSLTGAGTAATVAGRVDVGVAATATATINSGAQLTSAGGIIGSFAGSTGTVTLQSAGTVWNSSAGLVVGDLGTGTLNVDFDAHVAVAGPLTLARNGGSGTLNLTGGGSVSGGGTLTATGIFAGSTGASALTLDGGTLDLQGYSLGDHRHVTTLNFRAGTLRNVAQINNGDTGLTKTTGAALTLDGVNTYTGPTTVQEGTLVLKSTLATSPLMDVADLATVRLAASTSAPGTVFLKTATLNLHATGHLDLADNRLALTATTPAQLRNYLRVGQAYSSTALADPQQRLAVGFATAAQANATSWGGAPVAPANTVARLTWLGDADLDGLVDPDDYLRIDRAYALGGLPNAALWADGDFNYDATVNVFDYSLIDQVYLQQTGSLSPDFLSQRESQFGPAYVSALLASIPEPSSLSPILYPLFSLLPRRRR